MNSHTAALFVLSMPAMLLFVGSIILISKCRSAFSWLQLIGSAGLMLVVLTHFAEAFELIPWTGWGLENSTGHWLDLGSAVVALTLFPIGYLAHALAR